MTLAPTAAAKIARYESLGHGSLPVCMAKTQNSLSDDPKKLGRPRDFTLAVRDAKLAAGAGFVVTYASDVRDHRVEAHPRPGRGARRARERHPSTERAVPHADRLGRHAARTRGLGG